VCVALIPTVIQVQSTAERSLRQTVIYGRPLDLLRLRHRPRVLQRLLQGAVPPLGATRSFTGALRPRRDFDLRYLCTDHWDLSRFDKARPVTSRTGSHFVADLAATLLKPIGLIRSRFGCHFDSARPASRTPAGDFLPCRVDFHQSPRTCSSVDLWNFLDAALNDAIQFRSNRLVSLWTLVNLLALHWYSTLLCTSGT